MGIRVVVAEDDAAVRAATVDLLAADGRFEVVDAVATADEAVAAARAGRPDAVVLDLRRPGGGLTAARAIQADGSGAAVVVASARVDPTRLTELLRAGVRGVVLKGKDAAQLPDVLARCAAGEVLLLLPSAADAVQRAALR
ncbi:MAG TPA: response regulator [Jatrophihabitans sp.]|nr:response regulator [Jatrophihabitans sp.]